MTKMVVPAGAKSASIRARVIRADGRVEDLGLIAFHHKNWIIRRAVNAWLVVKRILPWRQS